MSATPATRTAAEEVVGIIIDLHAAVDARIKVCPVLVLAATFIFRTLGNLRDGLAALVGRVPGRASPRRRTRRPPQPPRGADTGSASTASAPGSASTASAPGSAPGASATAGGATVVSEAPTDAMSPGETAATAAATATDAKPRPSKPHPRKPRRWPSKYRAIADLIGEDAAVFAARLRALLADPEARAYLRANPAFADYLRPICRGFRVRLVPELRRKPAFRIDEEIEEIEPFEETPPVEPEIPSPIETIAEAAAEPAPAPAPEPPPPPTPQPSPVLPPQPPMYGIGPPDWTPTDPGPSMKERVDKWLARQRALGRI